MLNQSAAFNAYLRAYATHSKETKSIFFVRGLHFGHVARSFGLKEPPTELGAKGSKESTEEKGNSKKRKFDDKQDTVGSTARPAVKKTKGLTRLQSSLNTSEFGA